MQSKKGAKGPLESGTASDEFLASRGGETTEKDLSGVRVETDEE